MNAENSKVSVDHLKPHQFKPGQSGNPGGRPKDTLKAFMQNEFRDMSEEDKRAFLKGVPPEVIWKMAEGNPANNTDVTSNGQTIVVAPTQVAQILNDKESNEEASGSNTE